jgi:hypothetical protein
MTLQELEQRLGQIEIQVAECRRDLRPLRPFRDESETFGLFANDAEFDEIIRLGRDYRERANADDQPC